VLNCTRSLYSLAGWLADLTCVLLLCMPAVVCCPPPLPLQDKTRAGDFAKAEGLTIIPSEAEISSNPLTQFQKFFSPDSLGSMLGGSS
jgi:hypothetical protein